MKKRLVALLLSVSVVFGQTVYAEELTSDKTDAAENGAEQENYVGDWVYGGNQEDSVETEEMTVYSGQPTIKELEPSIFKDDVKDVRAEVEDESVCSVSTDSYEKTYSEGEVFNHFFFTVNGLKEGSTTVTVRKDSMIYKKYHITIRKLPEDAVKIKDPVLRYYLSDSTFDQNEDGYISQEELKKINSLEIDGTQGIYSKAGLRTLEGLEGAEQLSWVDLKGNKDLTNVDALFGKERIWRIVLQGTAVSDEDRWKLAGFEDLKDQETNKGTYYTIYDEYKKESLFEENPQITLLDPDHIAEVRENSYLLAKDTGTCKVKIQYHNLSKEFAIKINGIPADQEVGETSGITVDKRIFTPDDRTVIIDSNHTLWQAYPTYEKIRDDVKDFISEVVYSIGNSEEVGASVDIVNYVLDTADTLWKDEQKLVENVEKVDGRYALDKDGNLHNIYNQENEVITGVSSWTNPQYNDYWTVYILKKDGTLWKRNEVSKDQNVNSLEKVADGVKQLEDWAYLTEDGTIHSFDPFIKLNIKVEKINSEFLAGKNSPELQQSVYDTDGKLWIRKGGMYGMKFYPTGLSQKVVDYTGSRSQYFFLTEDGTLYNYEYDESTDSHTCEVLLKDIKEICTVFDSEREYEDTAFIGKDGTYYNINGEIIEDAVQVKNCGRDELVYNADGTKTLVRNGIELLTQCVSGWGDSNGSYYVLRTDGTVWCVDGVPEKVADLNGKEMAYLRGDVNEDQTVDEADTVLILRNLCNKQSLTKRQTMIADVTGDGSMDIKDARKLVRYLNGRIDSLD